MKGHLHSMVRWEQICVCWAMLVPRKLTVKVKYKALGSMKAALLVADLCL